MQTRKPTGSVWFKCNKKVMFVYLTYQYKLSDGEGLCSILWNFSYDQN